MKSSSQDICVAANCWTLKICINCGGGRRRQNMKTPFQEKCVVVFYNWYAKDWVVCRQNQSAKNMRQKKSLFIMILCTHMAIFGSLLGKRLSRPGRVSGWTKYDWWLWHAALQWLEWWSTPLLCTEKGFKSLNKLSKKDPLIDKNWKTLKWSLGIF